MVKVIFGKVEKIASGSEKNSGARNLQTLTPHALGRCTEERAAGQAVERIVTSKLMLQRHFNSAREASGTYSDNILNTLYFHLFIYFLR